jgi:hypothetical protein
MRAPCANRHWTACPRDRLSGRWCETALEKSGPDGGRQRADSESRIFQHFQLPGADASRDAGSGRATWRPIALHHNTLPESQPK